MNQQLRIALVGYGKMGKAIEEIAGQKGHSIVLKIDKDNSSDLTPENLKQADVAIEFTGPESAFDNIKTCLAAGVPVVSGSTGWLQHWEEMNAYCKSCNGTLLYASNFSIGVNIFFELNKKLAGLMASHTEYDVSIDELHHTQKLDAPSGTAITLAEQVLHASASKKQWVKAPAVDAADLSITSRREDPAPGTHHVKYSSAIDDIEIIHTAHNRKGFAGGAILAAEFVCGKKGIFTMKDVLGF